MKLLFGLVIIIEGWCKMIHSKKELKQKIAESFANKKIKYKSQYIRDLIEDNVSEELSTVRTTSLERVKQTINTIDERQINGYEAFKNNSENLVLLRSEIVKQRVALVLLIISNAYFSYLAVV